MAEHVILWKCPIVPLFVLGTVMVLTRKPLLFICCVTAQVCFMDVKLGLSQTKSNVKYKLL